MKSPSMMMLCTLLLNAADGRVNCRWRLRKQLRPCSVAKRNATGLQHLYNQYCNKRNVANVLYALSAYQYTYIKSKTKKKIMKGRFFSQREYPYTRELMEMFMTVHKAFFRLNTHVSSSSLFNIFIRVLPYSSLTAPIFGGKKFLKFIELYISWHLLYNICVVMIFGFYGTFNNCFKLIKGTSSAKSFVNANSLT